MTDDQAIDAYVRKVVAAAPPLSPEQRSELAELLRPIRLRSEEEKRSQQ